LPSVARHRRREGERTECDGALARDYAGKRDSVDLRLDGSEVKVGRESTPRTGEEFSERSAALECDEVEYAALL
jgi:hypothetical protein